MVNSQVILAKNTGQVLSATRRSVQILSHDKSQIIAGRALSKTLDIIVGDYVRYQLQADKAVVIEISERKNCIRRVMGNITKKIASNLDLLVIVAATEPLFNLSFIDRVLAACHFEDIPAALLVNKTDLGIESIAREVAVYGSLGLKIIESSVKSPSGLQDVHSTFMSPEYNVIALAGVSGVGKSSIIKAFVPSATPKTADVSKRTGQGRQTTSLAIGYPYPESTKEKLLIDLPGIQNFGVTHLPYRELKEAFPEFVEYSSGCEYSDCLHTAEPNCAIKEMVIENQIAPWRYESYTSMLAEIEAAKPY